MSNLNPYAELFEYEKSKLHYLGVKAVSDTAKEEGRVEGKIENKIEIAKKMKQRGLILKP